MPKTYQEMMSDFERKYRLTTTFQEMYDIDSRKPVNRSVEDQYMTEFSYMLNNYIDTFVDPAMEYKDYDLHDMRLLRFVEDFEDVMKAKYEQTNPDGERRKAYENMEGRVFKYAIDRVSKLDKPLVQVWANRIYNGKYDVETMRDSFKNEEMSIENKIIMQQAMEKVSENRRWTWKINPLNWRRWYQESKFLSELSKDVKPYKDNSGEIIIYEDRPNGNIYDEVVREHNGSPLISKTSIEYLNLQKMDIYAKLHQEEERLTAIEESKSLKFTYSKKNSSKEKLTGIDLGDNKPTAKSEKIKESDAPVTSKVKE
jgi:hypothetical protein